jgi:hypothetical protein
MSRRKRTILKDRGESLCRHRQVLRIAAACRDGKAMFAEGPDLDLESEVVEERFDLSISCAFERIQADD